MPLRPELGGFGEYKFIAALTRSEQAQPVWARISIWILQDCPLVPAGLFYGQRARRLKSGALVLGTKLGGSEQGMLYASCCFHFFSKVGVAIILLLAQSRLRPRCSEATVGPRSQYERDRRISFRLARYQPSDVPWASTD